MLVSLLPSILPLLLSLLVLLFLLALLAALSLTLFLAMSESTAVSIVVLPFLSFANSPEVTPTVMSVGVCVSVEMSIRISDEYSAYKEGEYVYMNESVILYDTLCN